MNGFVPSPPIIAAAKEIDPLVLNRGRFSSTQC